MELDPQAKSLNYAVKAANPAVLEMLSAKGKAIIFRKLGKLDPIQRARSVALLDGENQRTGIFVDDAGSEQCLVCLCNDVKAFDEIAELLFRRIVWGRAG